MRSATRRRSAVPGRLPAPARVPGKWLRDAAARSGSKFAITRSPIARLDANIGLILVRILQDEAMRKASRRGGKRRRAADRREPRGIEGGLAARAVERLMREIAQFIDEKTDLPHGN